MALLQIDNNQVEDSFDLAYKVDHEKYSEKARFSRNIVSCLIDDIHYLAHQELSFRGSLENTESENRKLFRISS
jgi:hypothetical protein